MKETPINTEAEQIVLAGLCIGLYESRAVNFRDFYDERHKALLKVILSLLEQVSVIDSLLLYNEVERLNLNAKVGGELYVIDIVEGKQIEAKGNPEYWLKKLKEISNKRKSLVFANQLSYDIEFKDITLNEINSKLTKFTQDLNTATNAKDTFNIKNLIDFMGNEAPEINWIVDGLIVEGSVILLVAKPKIGKSMLALNIALAVSKGEEILNKKTKKGRTLYIALEDREKLVQGRLWTMLNKPENYGIDISCDDILLNDSAFRNQLTLRIIENNYNLVVIDPLIETYRNADESSANDMVKVMGWIRELAQTTGSSFLVVHHSRKSDGEGGDVIRGSSAIWGAVDGSIFLKPLQTDNNGKKVSIEAILRDAESGEKAVISLNNSLGWELEGTFEEFQVKSTKEKIIEYLMEGEATTKEVSTGIGIHYETVSKCLQRMYDAEEVDRRPLGTNRNSGHKYFLSHGMSHDNVPREKVIDIEDLPKLFDSHGTN